MIKTNVAGKLNVKKENWGKAPLKLTDEFYLVCLMEVYKQQQQLETGASSGLA